MKKFLLIVLAAMICAGLAAGQQKDAKSSALTVIRAGTLIDGTSDTPKKNQLIFVRGERIEKVTDGSTVIPADAAVVDLSSATVLPGLIDAHTHIFLWGEDPNKGGYDANILKAGIAQRAARATAACRRALEQGFTTLRDVETEGAGYGDVEIKAAIAEGFTKRYRINRLVYFETFRTPVAAISREKAIKGLLRIKKLALIESVNPTWEDLSAEWEKPGYRRS